MSFTRWRNASSDDEVSNREEAFRKLADLDKKEGPFVAVGKPERVGSYSHAVLRCDAVSAGAFLHKYKPIDAQFCKQLPELGLVVGMGAGYDSVYSFSKSSAADAGPDIDTDSLSSSSVYYCNTPVSVSVPTADSASVLILTTLKNTIQGDRNVRAGNWNRGVPAGLNPSGRLIPASGSSAAHCSHHRGDARNHWHGQHWPNHLQAHASLRHESFVPQQTRTARRS